jgi:DNA-binding GntR family transcriptional regulator
MHRYGWSYLCPVPTPEQIAEIGRLRAALEVEIGRLRAALEAEIARLRAALERCCTVLENDPDQLNTGAVVDTVWNSRDETLVDFISHTLEGNKP